VAAALGAAVLLAWMAGIEEVTRVVPSLAAPTPGSGLMLAGAGGALLLAGGSSNGTRIGSVVCAALVLGLAAATLLEYATGHSVAIDLQPWHDGDGRLDPGRPATHTAVAYMLVGAWLLAARVRGRAGDAAAILLSAGAAGSTALAVAGYLVGVHYLYEGTSAHAMSVVTTVGLSIVIVGAFALRPDTPPASWYARHGGGEAAARQLMLPALIVPFAVAALLAGLARADAISGRFALAVFVVLIAAFIQWLIDRAVTAVRAHERVAEAVERERRETVRRFTTLASRAPVGIFETDAAGRTIFVSERWSEISGIPRAAALAGQGRAAVHPDDRERVNRDWRRAAEAGRDYEADFRFQRPDGTIRWVTAHAAALRGESGEIAGYLGTILDVTERRAAEERAGTVVSRIAEAVSIIGPDGRQLQANAAAEAILGGLATRFEEGAVGDLPWSAVRPDGRPLGNDELPAEVTRATGREVDEEVVGFPGAGGDTRWLRISTRRLSDEGPPYVVVASYADVTEELRAAAQLAEAESRFELAFDHAPIGVALVGVDGSLRRVNRALCEMFGLSEEELVARTFQELDEGDDASLESDLEQLRRVVEGDIRSYQMEKRYTHADGQPVWALVSVSLVRDDAGKPLHFIAQIMDVTERRRLERELRHLAEHDALTGLANRRVFNAELGRHLARERRYGGESALLIVDLDGFKEVNDTLGHAVGDLVLQGTAHALRERVRETDLVARLGGDEFAVLLPGTPRQGAETLAVDLVHAVRELRVDAESEASVTASIGVAVTSELPPDGDEDTLLAAADLAMYESKRHGRDGFSVFRRT
jgi:diguanylate cyclase (GGDEF)-like protein/PAS domain S-box-containing protein